MTQKIDTDRFYENKWFWVAAFGAVVLFSAIGGFYSAGGNVQATIETVQQARKTSTQSSSIGDDPINIAEQVRSAGIGRSLNAVQKLMQEGVIQRLNEPGRNLYVNDALWELMTPSRKERIARVVAEYLDWVNDSHTRQVSIFSFRNGGRIAEIGKGGAFRLLR